MLDYDLLTLKAFVFPLVFLHGFLGTKEDWNAVRSFFSETSFAIDLPGHGKAPFSEQFTLPFSQKIHLVGYSMGGRLAVSFANANPEKIATLTLISTFTGKATPNRVESDQIWAQKILHSFDDFLKEWYDQPIFAGFTPDLTMRKQQNPTSLAQTLLHYSPAKFPLIPPKNACYVVGERDVKYRKLYPNAIIVPNAGHMVHIEQPEAIANIIKKRIYDLDPSR